MSNPIILSLSIYAFAIVISMLVAVMIRGIVLAFALARPSSSSETSASATPRPVIEDIPIAAISAAVFAVVGPHRIVHIEHASRGHDWTTEGRSTHHLSHNIPRRRH